MLRKTFIILSVVFIAGCGTLQLGIERSPAPNAPASNATSAQSPDVVVTDAPPSVAQANTPTPAAEQEVATIASVTVTAVPPTTAFAPTVPPANVPSTSACVARHTVQPGEGLFRIGQQYGVDWHEIARVNNIADPSLIYAGQVLCIPAAGAIATLSATPHTLPPKPTGTQTPPTPSPTALQCQFAWFFSSQPQQGCPRESPLQSSAAAQSFERGTMIWVKQLGRYFILSKTFLFEGDVRKRLDYVHDPLDIIRDTSAEVHPPTGLYAPVSGFGLIWRGDVRQSSGYREGLGWALAPESGYDTMYQCDDARPSGGYNWAFCYLRGPGGEVIVLHPQGGWYLLGER